MKPVLIVLCFALVGSFIYSEQKGKYILADALKGSASLCFVVLGLVCSKGAFKEATLIRYGLLFGMGGDILLNLRYVFKENGQKVFLVGILVFLIGHIFYLADLLKHAERVLVPICLGVVVTAFLLKWIFSKVTTSKAFKIFGVIYVGAVTMMAVTALWNLSYGIDGASLLFAIGGLLFLISDLILIMNTFTGTTRFSRRIMNLSLYYLGQILIALSLLYR